MHLSDLPHFTVSAVHELDGVVKLSGQFSRVRGVREGRSWLYVSGNTSIIGDLEQLDTSAASGVFDTFDWALRPPISPEAGFPWIDGYWQAYHVGMIVDPTHVWVHTEFIPGAARHFRLAGVHGWQPVDAPLPEGATDLGVRPGDWDHEHCEICQGKIGRSGDADGFRDADGRWLCTECHGRYAALHDVSFLIDA